MWTPHPHPPDSVARSRPIAVWILALALAGSLAGCAGEPAPQQVLPDSTMIRVISDLHLATARYELDDGAAPGLRDSVLAMHGLDSTAFEEAMAWYRAHPSEYAAVYGAVIDRLNAERNP